MKNISVRFPTELHERIAARADSDMRSLNAEILWLLALGLEAAERRDRIIREQSSEYVAIPA